MMDGKRPRLALVSIGIRRDLIAPLVFFSKLDLVHFYRKNVYNDMTTADVDSAPMVYSTPLELYRKLVIASPAVIQGVEPFSFYTQQFVWACVLAARKLRAALLIPTYENRPLDIKFGKWRAGVLRGVLRTYLARACLVITHNNGARENVLQCGGAPQKIVRGMWGSWGVDTREFFPRPERSSHEASLAPTVLFVGRLHEEKGVLVLLNAFSRVLAQVPTARLVLAGDGPARSQVESEIVSRQMSGVVTLLGVVKNRDMPHLFRRADVFCAPSITTRKWAEQVGMSSLQAMACGLPVVSTYSGAIPEYIPDGLAGILVPEGDAGALANALVELLTNRTRAGEMGAYACEYARAHYDAQTNVERDEQLVLEHCLAHRV